MPMNFDLKSHIFEPNRIYLHIIADLLADGENQAWNIGTGRSRTQKTYHSHQYFWIFNPGFCEKK